MLTADDLLSTSALWFVEQIVDGLVECGLSSDGVVHGYRAIWYTPPERSWSGRRRREGARPMTA